MGCLRRQITFTPSVVGSIERISIPELILPAEIPRYIVSNLHNVHVYIVNGKCWNCCLLVGDLK